MTPPAGKITSVITYLEMTEQPTSPTPPTPAAKLALLRAEQPSCAFYRFLHDQVGGGQLWREERRAMSDAELARIIADDRFEVYVLYAAGVPAGFSEFDRRRRPDIELACFGLLPDFAGRGFGAYLLRWTIDQAWTHQPERLWVRASSGDDPHALSLYQRCGFVVYDQKTVTTDDLDPDAGRD